MGPPQAKAHPGLLSLSYVLMDNSRGATRAGPAPPPSEAMPLGQVERQKSIPADCGMTQDTFTTQGQEPWDCAGHLQLNCSIRSMVGVTPTNFTEGLGSTLSTLLRSLESDFGWDPSIRANKQTGPVLGRKACHREAVLKMCHCGTVRLAAGPHTHILGPVWKDL